jgi:hypothetical protein
MIGKNRFSCVTEVHEKLNVSRCAQHGAGIKLVGIGRGSFNCVDEGLSHSLTLMSGTHGKQPDHAYASYRPEAHGTGDRSPHFCHENMFLSGIFLQALKGFCGPPAHLVDARIFAECSLLHVEQRGKVRVGRQSNMNHHMHPGEEEPASVLHSGSNSNWQDIGLVRGKW